MKKCKYCNGTRFISLGKGIRGMKKCENCNGTGFEPTENDTVELGATVIEFIDTADRIEEISNFVGKEIAVDYSGENPVLKVDGMLIHEHEYIGKMNDTGRLFVC